MSNFKREEALRLYGQLLRVMKKTFSKDEEVIKSAWSKTKIEFSKPITDQEILKKKLKETMDIIKLLEHNIAQAELISPNTYRKELFSLLS